MALAVSQTAGASTSPALSSVDDLLHQARIFGRKQAHWATRSNSPSAAGSADNDVSQAAAHTRCLPSPAVRAHGLQDLRGAAHATNARKHALDSVLVVFGRVCGHGVLDENLIVAMVKRRAGRRLHAHVGRNPGENYGVDGSAPQLDIQVGAVKGTPLVLGDDGVAEFLSQLGNEFCPIRGKRASGRVQIDPRMGKQVCVWARVDANQDDKSASCPEFCR